MRIAGGDWKGRNLRVPSGDAVRPTQDRVREALFSMLQFELAGAVFLDLFAGSGAVAFEALSRGAARATLVELAPRHLACIQANAVQLGASSRCNIVRADVYAWLASQSNSSFDIAYADPPYALGVEQGYARVLAQLAERNIVKPNGLFIAEMKSHQTPDASPLWDLCRDRTYGQTRIAVYRRRAELADLARQSPFGRHHSTAI
ncbi:MAG: 16S rRNA (guanine(966)-N(2))-methyltransferase RsmD [Kiritimatiellia bacterium]